MKILNRLTNDSFISNGEVNEGLPLYNKNIQDFFKLDGSVESYYPSLEIGVSENRISTIHGDGNLIRTINRVVIDEKDNTLLNFAQASNSYIEVNKSLFESNRFEFEIMLKPTNFSRTTANLLTIKTEVSGRDPFEFVLGIDNNKRLLYLTIPNIDGLTNTPYDESNRIFLTTSGTLNKDLWYKIKLVKDHNIIACYVNEMLTRIVLAEGTFQPSRCYVGYTDNSIYGLVKYVSFRKLHDTNELRIPIRNGHSFSMYHKVLFKKIGTFNLLSINNLKTNLNNNKLVFLNNTTEVGHANIQEDKEYFISYIYDNSQLNIYVYDIYNKRELLNIRTSINSLNEVQVFDIKNIYDLCIYKIYIPLNEMKRNCNPSFSMNQSCDIYNEILEEFYPFKLKENINGSKHYLPLSHEIKSSDDLIKKDVECVRIDGGLKTGVFDNTNCFDLINYNKVLPANFEWDSKLHYGAYRIDGWSIGYNSGVTNPNIGYHAHCCYEGSNNNICLKFINCNEQFNEKNRWLGLSRPLSSINFKIGDKIQVRFRAKADINTLMAVGIYHVENNSNSPSFGNNLKDIKINGGNSWDEYIYECDITPQWNLSGQKSLYFYSYNTNNSTLWIEDVFLLINKNSTYIDIMKDTNNNFIQIPFSRQIGQDYNNSFSIIYDMKICSLKDNSHYDSLGLDNGISWGIKNNKLFLTYAGTTKEESIDTNLLLNKWITVCLQKNNSHEIFATFLGKNLNKTIKIQTTQFTPSNLHNSTYDYDLMLGGKNNINIGCALYKDLVLLKNTFVDSNSLVDYYRTKMSVKNNKLYSRVSIIESQI